MIKNTRIYLKSHINESVLLDESGEIGLTEFKQFIISLIKFLFHVDVTSNYPNWVIHHIDTHRENNDISNIALMTPKAHNSFHGTAKYYEDYPETLEGLKAWLGDIEKAGDKAGDKKDYLNQVIILQDVLINKKLKISYKDSGTNKTKSELTKNPNNNLLKSRGNKSNNKSDNNTSSEIKSQQ